jgi:hypothetical protein
MPLPFYLPLFLFKLPASRSYLIGVFKGIISLIQIPCYNHNHANQQYAAAKDQNDSFELLIRFKSRINFI